MQPNDTNKDIDERMTALYRSMSPAEKIARMFALTELAHPFALAAIRDQHPTESDREHRLRMASRWLTRKQMIDPFGWDPDAHR